MPRLIACISDYLISKDRQSVHSHFVGLTSCVPTFMSDLVQNFPSAQPQLYTQFVTSQLMLLLGVEFMFLPPFLVIAQMAISILLKKEEQFIQKVFYSFFQVLISVKILLHLNSPTFTTPLGRTRECVR